MNELTPSILDTERIQRVGEDEQGNLDRNEIRSDDVVEDMVGTMGLVKPSEGCSKLVGTPGKEERSVERTGLQELVVRFELWLEVGQQEMAWC